MPGTEFMQDMDKWVRRGRNPFTTTGGPWGEGHMGGREVTPAVESTVANSFRPIPGLANVLRAGESTIVTRLVSPQAGNWAQPDLETVGETAVVSFWEAFRDVASGFIGTPRQVFVQWERAHSRFERERVLRAAFEEEQSLQDLEHEILWHLFRQSFKERSKEPSLAPLAEWFVEKSLSALEISTEAAEEVFEIQPKIAFGSLPVPKRSKRIRLTPKTRAALPLQIIPKNLSVEVGEEEL